MDSQRTQRVGEARQRALSFHFASKQSQDKSSFSPPSTLPPQLASGAHSRAGIDVSSAKSSHHLHASIFAELVPQKPLVSSGARELPVP